MLLGTWIHLSPRTTWPPTCCPHSRRASLAGTMRGTPRRTTTITIECAIHPPSLDQSLVGLPPSVLRISLFNGHCFQLDRIARRFTISQRTNGKWCCDRNGCASCDDQLLTNVNNIYHARHAGMACKDAAFRRDGNHPQHR